MISILLQPGGSEKIEGDALGNDSEPNGFDKGNDNQHDWNFLLQRCMDGSLRCLWMFSLGEMWLRQIFGVVLNCEGQR